MRATPFSLTTPWNIAWRTQTGVVINAITAHDDVAVVAPRDVLIGLELATGNERWRRPMRKPVGLVPSTNRGPIACSFEKGITELDAFDWSGKPRWSLRREWFISAEGIHAEGDTILCAGRYDKTGALICAYVDDATGKVTAEYPCIGVQPRAIAGALLYRGDGDGEHAGLFRVDHATGKVRRLTSLVVQDYAVAGDVAVVNTGEELATELVAIDIASANVRWRAPGGLGCAIVIDGDDVVTGIRDGDTIGVVTRALRDGSPRWAAPLVPATSLMPFVTPTLVIAHGADDRIDVYDRATGRQVQQLDTVSGYAGAAMTQHGFIDVRMRGEVVCWRGA
jgi:hypothetical protein